MLVLTLMSIVASMLIIYSVGPGERQTPPSPTRPYVPGIVGAMPEPSRSPSMSDVVITDSSPSAGATPSASPSAAATTARPTTTAPRCPTPRATTTSARPPAVPVTASYSVRTDWGDGFVADIVVRNAGGAPANWTVELTYTNDVSITSTNTWNATVERIGPMYRFSGTAVLKPGESVQFGFVASKYRGWSTPSRCVVNSRPCS